MCYDLGFRAENGSGVERDYARAASWYRKGCRSESVDACYALGAMYHEGKGLFQDKKQAVAFYKRACELGKDVACSQLERVKDSKTYSGARGWKFQ